MAAGHGLRLSILPPAPRWGGWGSAPRGPRSEESHRPSRRWVRLRWPVSRGARLGGGGGQVGVPALVAPRHSPARTPAARPALRSIHGSGASCPVGRACHGPCNHPARPRKQRGRGRAGQGPRQALPCRFRPPGSHSAPSLAWVVGRPFEGLPLGDSRVHRVVTPAHLRSSLRAGPPPPLAKLRSYVAGLRSLRRRSRPPLLSSAGRLVHPLCHACGLVVRAGGIARTASPFG